MKLNKETMRKAVEEDFSNATDLADYLVKKGLPFRAAHGVSGKAVNYCIKEGKYLQDLSLEELKNFSPLFDKDVKEAIKADTCVKNRNSYGGTGHEQVKMQIDRAKKIIENELHDIG